ncbi:MAG: TolC family protein [Bacteroidota bacterium]
MNKIVSVILLGWIVFSGHSQELMDVRACVDYAIEHNLSLKNYQYNIQRQEANMVGAYGNMLPVVNASSNLNISQGRTTDPNTNQIIDADPFLSNNYGLNGNVPLFNGFRLQNQLKFEKYSLLAANETYEKQKNNITYLIMDSYIQYLISLGLTEIQAEQLEASTKEVYRINKQIELGLSSGSEKYESEAQMATDEYLLIQNQNLANKNENNLKKLLNYPIDSTLNIAEIEIDPSRLTPINDEMISPNPEILPEVQSTMALLNAAKKQLNAARSSLSPSLSAYANWGTGYLETRTNANGDLIPYGEQLNLNGRTGYGLSLNIPVFNQLNRRNTIQQAKINHEEAENNLTTLIRDTEYLINEAILDYEGAIAEYESARKREQSMELAFEVVQKKREKGLVGIMEFYLAKNNLASARGQSLRTKLQLFLSERNINFYLTGSFFE